MKHPFRSVTDTTRRFSTSSCLDNTCDSTKQEPASNLKPGAPASQAGPSPHMEALRAQLAAVDAHQLVVEGGDGACDPAGRKAGSHGAAPSSQRERAPFRQDPAGPQQLLPPEQIMRARPLGSQRPCAVIRNKAIADKLGPRTSGRFRHQTRHRRRRRRHHCLQVLAPGLQSLGCRSGPG